MLVGFPFFIKKKIKSCIKVTVFPLPQGLKSLNGKQPGGIAAPGLDPQTPADAVGLGAEGSAQEGVHLASGMCRCDVQVCRCDVQVCRCTHLHLLPWESCGAMHTCWLQTVGFQCFL